MALLVDECVWPWRDRRWCHLVSDRDLAEVHAGAERLGLPRRAFQGDHYDLDETLRVEAIGLGARAVSWRELVTRLVASGLRLPPADRRAAARRTADAVLQVRAADGSADVELLSWHLAGVPGGTATWCAEWGRRPGDVAVVADDGNRVGVAVCRVIGDEGAASVAVAVARPCRGRGIGASLLDGLSRRAAIAGHHALCVVLPEPGGALERLARSAGFRDGDRPGRLERRLA